MFTHNDIISILEKNTSDILVDKILYFELGNYLYAIKNVSIADLSFLKKESKLYSSNLFLIVEVFYQALILFCELSNLSNEIVNIQLGTIETNVVPGDTLCIDIKVIEQNNQNLKIEGQILKDGQIIFKPVVLLKMSNGVNL